MPTSLNLGILAHVDAGKTSLTERLLHAAGVIDEVGSVDDGSTQTDTLALERRRGITIKSAVVSFAIDGLTVNLIDTPGHPDFIAEVERVLSVLDGAILVVSAVEGVQAQTRVLMRTLRRLGIPTLIFINKVDRRGADPVRVQGDLADKLGLTLVAAHAPELEVLAEHNDHFLGAYVEGRRVPHLTLKQELARQTEKALVHPVFTGSASTGAGVAALITGIKQLLPAARGWDDDPVDGTVFKVERGPAGEKIAYVRMRSGTLRTRERLTFGKVTAINVFADGTDTRTDEVAAGQIAKVWGLNDVRVGDTLGDAQTKDEHFFAPPTLETVVTPVNQRQRGALNSALTQLAEQDPLINLRHINQDIAVSLYGEVQKEVIQATLADDYGIDVTFHETTTIHIERPHGTGAAFELIAKDPNPFLATVGLRIDPAPVGTGVRYQLEVELGSMPYAFMRAVEDTVYETLHQGLHGWQVTDCVVTMTHSGYWARQSHSHGTFDKSMSSTAGDFRNLTPLVLMDALRQAGTTVYEPMHQFTLTLPTDTLSAVLPVLSRLRAIPRTRTTNVLEGTVPAAHVHELERLLPGLTSGEAEWDSSFSHYGPVTGAVPDRPRTDHNPLNRKDYLLNVSRRVGA
ncbi:translation factor GTPase family protein [Actinocrispum sp. NPDC049592]|uniref:translation factor GTPase family protein n=1 Tax=Actinocrispum sp. NPDC049592 TaxID=3154835 RepID=UPI00343A9B49